MLTNYLTATKQLLQNPAAPTALYADADLTSWINRARNHTAGESECILATGTVAAVVSQRNYDFTSINFGVASSVSGIQAPIHVRSLQFGIGSGQKWIGPVNWEWFTLYNLNNPVPSNGQPIEWSQYHQGVTGNFFLEPPPDNTYTLYADCACYPITLVDDTTVEAIPFYFTTAVPYYAAYLAYLSAQNGMRQADAQNMHDRYLDHIERARKYANPSVNRFLYQQSTDMTQMAKLGLKPGGGGGAG